MKKILILGGSYFVGRVFTILAGRTGEFDMTVVNRGKYKFGRPELCREFFLDRHDKKALSELPAESYDAVIDFCAYEPGDISSVLECCPIKTKQYIYISTASVYSVSAPLPVTEASPLETRFGEDENSLYVKKKLLLEDELRLSSEKAGCTYTVFRPAFIYGPFNYAPREPLYFQHIIKNAPIPHPSDSTARFSFIYVKDIARILMKAVGNEKAVNEVFNLAGPEEVTYERFMEIIEKANGAPVLKELKPSLEIMRSGFPLPFPLDHDELYDGSKAADAFDEGYTPFESSLIDAYNVYMSAMRG